MKIPILNTDTIEQLRGFFHPKDRSVILADDTFIEGEEVTTPANPRHNRGRLYWKNRCWTQLDESGNESTLCNGIWQDWTPTVTQGVAVTVTVVYARYVIIGQTIIVEGILLVTSAGTGGQVVQIGGQPAAIQHGNTNSNLAVIGTILVFDSGVGFYQGAMVSSGPTSWRGYAHGLTGAIGQTPNFALANLDTIGFQAAYERA